MTPVERFKLLDRVRLLADPQPLPDHRVQVDEHPGAQQDVQLRLADSVTGGEPLQRRLLIWRVVVDVHTRVAAPPVEDVIDEGLGQRPFLVERVCPDRGELVVAVAEPGEVLQAVRLDVTVGLEVEVQVGRIGFGQPQ